MENSMWEERYDTGLRQAVALFLKEVSFCFRRAHCCSFSEVTIFGGKSDPLLRLAGRSQSLIYESFAGKHIDTTVFPGSGGTFQFYLARYGQDDMATMMYREKENA